MRIRLGHSPPWLGGAACLGPLPLGCGALLACSVLSAAPKGPTAGVGEGRAPLLVLPGARCQKSSPVGWAGGCPWARRGPPVCAVCCPLLCRPWEAAEPAPGGILEAAFCIAAALLLGGGRLCSSSRSGWRRHSTELGVSLAFRSLSGARGLVPRALHVSPWGRRRPSLCSRCHLTPLCCTAQRRGCSSRCLLLQKAPPSPASWLSAGQAPLWPPQAAPRLAAGDTGTGARPGQGAGHGRSAQPGRLPRSPPPLLCWVLALSSGSFK